MIQHSHTQACPHTNHKNPITKNRHIFRSDATVWEDMGRGAMCSHLFIPNRQCVPLASLTFEALYTHGRYMFPLTARAISAALSHQNITKSP